MFVTILYKIIKVFFIYLIPKINDIIYLHINEKNKGHSLDGSYTVNNLRYI